MNPDWHAVYVDNKLAGLMTSQPAADEAAQGIAAKSFRTIGYVQDFRIRPVSADEAARLMSEANKR